MRKPRKRNIAKVCLTCGIDFMTRYPDGKYCSLSCAAKRIMKTRDQRGSKNPNYKWGAALTNYQRKMKWRANNPEKAKVHDLFRDAIRRKEIIRQPCEVCGSLKADGHHEDYSKPYDVRWLCRLHHAHEQKKKNV